MPRMMAYWRSRVLAWVALAILAMAALAPTATRVLAASSLDPTGFASLCSADQRDPTSVDRDASCPLCVLQSHAVAITDGPSGDGMRAALPVPLRDVLVAAAHWAPSVSVPRSPALARAPPTA